MKLFAIDSLSFKEVSTLFDTTPIGNLIWLSESKPLKKASNEFRMTLGGIEGFGWSSSAVVQHLNLGNPPSEMSDSEGRKVGCWVLNHLKTGAKIAIFSDGHQLKTSRGTTYEAMTPFNSNTTTEAHLANAILDLKKELGERVPKYSPAKSKKPGI
jgi:hypothetical protein